MMKKVLIIAAFALSNAPLMAQNDVGIGTANPQARLDVVGNGISYDLMNVSNDKQFPADSIFVIDHRGHVAMGVSSPVEQLTLAPADGAIILGTHIQVPGSEVAGTIEWDGANFRGYSGTSWLSLDTQSDNDWVLINPSSFGTAATYGLQSGYLGWANPGTVPAVPITEFADLYVSNSSGTPGTFSNQLLLEESSGSFDASQHFLISNYQGLGSNLSYCMGIYNSDGAFKLSKSGLLQATFQGDATTMLRANPTGIIDHPNQSRVRAYQEDPMGFVRQLIPPNQWTPVNFNFDNLLPNSYDQQSEFLPALSVNQPVPPENAYFTATMDGYYQVNARCQFDVEYYEPDDFYPGWPGGTVQVYSFSFVSIAIYYGQLGASNPYSIGNQLQIGYFYTGPDGSDQIGKLSNNNAPNVSDVVFLQAGQIISIWVFHNALTPMNLIPGKARCYVSIHKVS